jgi:hypothetical protein
MRNSANDRRLARNFKRGDPLRELRGQLTIGESDRRIVADHTRHGGHIVVLRSSVDLAMAA